MGETTLLPDLATEIIIPLFAVVGIVFAIAIAIAIAIFQWLLVSKVKLSANKSSSTDSKNGFNEALIEEEEGANEHSVVRKCAEIQAAISEDDSKLKLEQKRAVIEHGITYSLEESRKMLHSLRLAYFFYIISGNTDGPHTLVCDEARMIKKTRADTTQALKQVKFQRRIALTGSPLQNNLMEYYCMVDFVREGFLGSSHEFRNRFQNPIENGQHTNSTALDVKIMNQRSHILYEELKGFVQRMDMKVVKSENDKHLADSIDEERKVGKNMHV